MKPVRSMLISGVALIAMAVPFAAFADDDDDDDERRSRTRPEFTQVVRMDGTIPVIAARAGSFNTLLTALQATGLDTTLQGDGPFTVFAPTDAAFAKIPAPVLNYFLANPGDLTQVLLYHVVPGIKDLRWAFRPRDLATAQGQDVYADRDRFELAINNALVQGRIIRADNGVIYVIDSVLLPQYR